MGRPAKHTADDFIDAAISLFAAGGARAVTLGAVAESVGAANGSIYHRFPDRPTLLAALWLRTSKGFETEYQKQLGPATIENAVAAAVWIVEWCGEHPEQAQVLRAGMSAFNPESWPAHARASVSTDADLWAQLRRHIRRLGDSTAAPPDQIVFAMMELPLAVVRRALAEGRSPGHREVDLVRGLATVILNR
jgi:AcrR family transcriptional regulator